MANQEYQPSYRENFEAKATAAWVGGMIAARLAFLWSDLPPLPFNVLCAVCAVMAIYRGVPAFRLMRRKHALHGHPIAFTTYQEVRAKMQGSKENIWFGHGFNWDQPHTQRVYEINSMPKKRLMHMHLQEQRMGMPWIHGVEQDEMDLYLPIINTKGHLALVGATQTGKSTAICLMVAQAVMRGEPVIIFDPKGDHAIRDTAREACELAGVPDRYVYIHPAFPEQSARIDPMRNFNRPTELASRIAMLLPSAKGGNDPFKAYGHMSLNNIIHGLLVNMIHPNLIRIRRYLEGDNTELVKLAIGAYCDEKAIDWHVVSRPYTERARDNEAKARGMIRYYREQVQPYHPSPDLEGLISMFEHNREHLQKMIASSMPIVTMLTSGHLGKLLSPDHADHADTRRITDIAHIIRNDQVAYIGLDSLSDPQVGSYLGSMLMADLAATAGDRYNYGKDLRPVNIFIDEMAEVLVDSLIQILNKGAGSLLRVVVATQTFGDVAAKLGDKDKARMVLGNLNNTLVLRTLDNETQEYLMEGVPKTKVEYILRTQGTATQPDKPSLFNSSEGEQLVREEVDLFPSALLGMLPNLEYIAKFSGGHIKKGRLPILKRIEAEPQCAPATGAAHG